MIGYLVLIVGLAALAFLAWRAERIWQDAGRRDFDPRQRIGWTIKGAIVPALYWWAARIEALSPQEQEWLLARETEALGVSCADSLRCPLCGAEIPGAWTLTGSGQPTVAAGLVHCPACDFRLDACRHCRHFLPGSPAGWEQPVWGQGDITFGRCDFYKQLQPVEQTAAPDIARRLRSRGYEQIQAPLLIQDSMLRPDFCRAFAPDRKRIEASAACWPAARRTALLRLLGRTATAEGSPIAGQGEPDEAG
jgi:hypothetical protein